MVYYPPTIEYVEHVIVEYAEHVEFVFCDTNKIMGNCQNWVKLYFLESLHMK